MVVFRNALVLFLICGHAFLFAESAPGTDAQPARPEAATAATTNAPVQKAAEDYYVETRGYGLKRVDGTRPSYAKKLSETGIAAFQNLSWLVAGIEQRTRYEYRENDFRRPNIANPQNIPGGEKPPLDQPVLFKTRLFLKVEDILDPFRFTVEMQDSRRTAAYYGVDDRDVNELEPIQAFGELHLKHMCGQNRPLVIRAGRMAFEFLDRRLIGLNEWRNTTNTFQGARVTIGQEKNNWYLELLGVQPLQRYIDKVDQPVGKQWFYGAILSIQEWSHIATIQPYYLGLQQDGLPADNSAYLPVPSRNYRNIHTAGVRAYAVLGKTGFDYDVTYTNQFGVDQLASNGNQTDMNAFAATAEIGYTFRHAWKPRLGAFYGFVSGDMDRGDLSQNRFDRLYGFARPWSAADYFQMENLNTPKLVIEFEPFEKLKIDTAYTWYWAASPHDRWNNGQILGTATAAGNVSTETKIGEEYNFRVRYPFPHLKVNVGYAFFKPGEYTTKFKRGGDSHFAYVELTAVLFD